MYIVYSSQYPKIINYSQDTDVFVIGMKLWHELQTKGLEGIWMKLGTARNWRLGP